MKEKTTRLQLTVLPRHLKAIETMKEDYETNSQFIMRMLDTMSQEKATTKKINNNP